jgi:hypothetical protein
MNSRSLLPQNLIVLSMSADPDPEQVRTIFDGQSSMVQPNACGPKLSDLLEVQRRMS